MLPALLSLSSAIAIAAVIIVILLEELESLASSAPDRARAGSGEGTKGGVAERTRARGKVLDDVEAEGEGEA